MLAAGGELQGLSHNHTHKGRRYGMLAAGLLLAMSPGHAPQQSHSRVETLIQRQLQARHMLTYKYDTAVSVDIGHASNKGSYSSSYPAVEVTP